MNELVIIGTAAWLFVTLPDGKDVIVEAPRTGLDVRITTQWMTVTEVLRPDGGQAI